MQKSLDSYPETVKAIVEQHCIDDYLVSVDKEEKAK